MYCVIISTRTDFRNCGSCYDIISCNSYDSAIEKLFTYHNTKCSGFIDCKNCYFYDVEQKELLKSESECRQYCQKCINNEPLQANFCSDCKYCGECDNCNVIKCEKCDIYCDNCKFNGELKDFDMPDYEYEKIKLKIYYTDVEIEKYGIRT